MDGQFALRLVFAMLFIVHGASCLQQTRVEVPPAVRRWETAVLRCAFDLEGESLYSVKWYKGKREFYRYTPKENPEVKVFSFPGLQVDVNKSNATQVTLQKVDLNLSGKYSCEVSADAPLFHTAVVSGELTIVEFPSSRPMITGVRSRYSAGDILEANCTSPKSKPAANLTWLINEEPAKPGYLKYYPPVREDSDMETSRLGLSFEVNSAHFRDGPLKLRCSAHIYSVYWQSTEKSADDDRPRLSSVVGTHEAPGPSASKGEHRRGIGSSSPQQLISMGLTAGAFLLTSILS